MIALADFVKQKRKEVNLTQEAFAERAGVALTVIRKIEQGKENLNLEKVNQVLEDLKERIELKLIDTRIFRSGVVELTYESKQTTTR